MRVRPVRLGLVARLLSRCRRHLRPVRTERQHGGDGRLHDRLCPRDTDGILRHRARNEAGNGGVLRRQVGRLCRQRARLQPVVPAVVQRRQAVLQLAERMGTQRYDGRMASGQGQQLCAQRQLRGRQAVDTQPREAEAGVPERMEDGVHQGQQGDHRQPRLADTQLFQHARRPSTRCRREESQHHRRGRLRAKGEPTDHCHALCRPARRHLLAHGKGVLRRRLRPPGDVRRERCRPRSTQPEPRQAGQMAADEDKGSEG